ncbi:glutathione S-transferase family protein [Inquilinus sp.]|uniref:glutathione S-transferase family protein n=1 Tax=Inquilinus sp. TaxID=1932117 RepID=UPI0031E4018F
MSAPAASALTLHWSPRSPFVRKVMIAAHELGIADRLTRVRNVVALHRPNDVVMAFNPLSKLPTLVVDRDGGQEVLYDSHVICSYLDARFGPGRLVPEALDDRMTALRQEALGDGVMELLLLRLFEGLRPEAARSAELLSSLHRKLRRSLEVMEQDLPSLARRSFDLGHLTIGVALSYLDFRFPGESWHEAHPALKRWHDGFSGRPSVQATVPFDDV